MKAIRLFTTAIMLVATTTMYAQFVNSGNGGNATSSNVNTDNYSRFEVSFASTTMEDVDDPFVGVSAGLLWGKSISESMPVFIEYGANLTWTARTFDYDSYYYDEEEKFNFLNVAIPINLAYKFTLPSNSDVSIVPFVGVNFKVGIIAKGKETYDGEDETYDLYDKDEGWDANRFQVGMNVGIGLNFNKYYIGYKFQPDFTEFAEKTKTHTNFVTLGINF